MTRRRVVLFSRDPGGCNSVTPLAAFLAERNFEVLLYAKDFAYQQSKTLTTLAPRDFNLELPAPSTDSVRHWLEKLAPAFVITGTSHGDFTERLIWQACAQLKIPSAAVLDHWINYGIRFTDAKGGKVLPSIIVVPDSDGSAIALREGLPTGRVRALGNPYYDFLSYRKNHSDAAKILRKKLLPEPNSTLVVFASEPFSLAPSDYGYNEKQILQDLIFALKENLPQGRHTTLLIRPHPKENRNELLILATQHSNKTFTAQVCSEAPSLEVIDAADLVCGMISQFLIEAVVMKKPTLSLQIGLNTDDPFILTHRGVIPLLTTKTQLDEAVQSFYRGELHAPEITLPSHSMEKILEQMEKLL